MAVAAYKGTVINGQIVLDEDVKLPEGALVYVIFPDYEPHQLSPKKDIDNSDDNA